LPTLPRHVVLASNIPVNRWSAARKSRPAGEDVKQCKNSKGERPWEGALALWGGGIVTGSRQKGSGTGTVYQSWHRCSIGVNGRKSNPRVLFYRHKKAGCFNEPGIFAAAAWWPRSLEAEGVEPSSRGRLKLASTCVGRILSRATRRLRPDSALRQLLLCLSTYSSNLNR